MRCFKCGTEYNGITCPKCAELALLAEQTEILRQESKKADQARHDQMMQTAHEEYRAREPEREAAVQAAIRECEEYARAEHMLPVCIAGLTNMVSELMEISYADSEQFAEKIEKLIEQYVSEDRGVNLDEFGRSLSISLTKADASALLQSTASSDKKITLFKYLDGFAAVPISCIAEKAEQLSGNPKKNILLSNATAIIWLRENELESFAEVYNALGSEFIALQSKLKHQTTPANKQTGGFPVMMIVVAIVVVMYLFIRSVL